MASQIANSELKGVLPVLLFFLAREQAQVVDVRLLGDAPEWHHGRTVRSLGAGGSQADPFRDCASSFWAPARPEKQTLYYFQFNLQNSSIERHPQFVSFLESFGPLPPMTKAASYLLFSRQQFRTFGNSSWTGVNTWSRTTRGSH